jgi:hypothetical protein
MSTRELPFGGWFWSAPAYLDYVQPPLTDAVVAAAESQLGVTLPAAYLALLRQQNGGYLRGSVPELGANQVLGIGPGWASITDDHAWWRAKDFDGFVPDGRDLLIPFHGDGHWDLCFDYRLCGPTGEPSIAHVDVEGEAVETVADSFTDLLADLEDELATAIHIRGPDLDEVAAALAGPLGAVAEDLGSFDYGYRTLRFALPGRHQWCWLSPNRVPAGFRRVGAKVFTTPETALRMRERPDCTVLVDCTDASREAVERAIGDAGLVLLSGSSSD